MPGDERRSFCASCPASTMTGGPEGLLRHRSATARPSRDRWLQCPATGPGGRPHLPRIDVAAFDDRCDGGLRRRRAGRGELAEGPAARGQQILPARERARRAHMHVESIPDETGLPERTAGDRDELFVNGLLGRGPGGRRGGACPGRRLTRYAETLS